MTQMDIHDCIYEVRTNPTLYDWRQPDAEDWAFITHWAKLQRLWGQQQDNWGNPADSALLTGKLGEWVYGNLIGLEPSYAIGNDGGTDYPGVDVKADGRWWNPRLTVYGFKPDMPYPLVAVDLSKRMGFYAGWAYGRDLREAGKQPFRVLESENLRPGLPQVVSVGNTEFVPAPNILDAA